MISLLRMPLIGLGLADIRAVVIVRVREEKSDGL